MRCEATDSVAADGRYELCLASALEEGVPFAAKVGALANLGPTAAAWEDAAIRHYARALDASVPSKRPIETQPLRFGPHIASEAANSYERMLKARGRSLSSEEAERLKRIAAFRLIESRLPIAITRSSSR